MSGGIYRINLQDGTCYIGKATCLSSRINRHKSTIRNGWHDNPYIDMLIKSGQNQVSFDVLELEDCPHLRRDKEAAWIAKHTNSCNFHNGPLENKNKGTSVRYAKRDEQHARKRIQIKEKIRSFAKWHVDNRSRKDARAWIHVYNWTDEELDLFVMRLEVLTIKHALAEAKSWLDNNHTRT